MTKVTKGLLSLISFPILANATSYTVTEYIKVEKSMPIYKDVVKQVPYEECEDVAVDNSMEKTGGALLGGILGGVLGHQVGGGHGKDAATIGGAILGSMAGGSMASSDDGVVKTERVCKTKYKEVVENRLTGYKNIGYFNGKEVVKYTQDSLTNIEVKITVSY